MPHDSFEHGAMTDKMIVFDPENIFYCYKTGRDLAPKMNIQSNSTDGQIDEILGEIGIGTLDGGQSILQVENLF